MAGLLNSLKEYFLGTQNPRRAQNRIRKTKSGAEIAVQGTLLDLVREARREAEKGNFRDAANSYDCVGDMLKGMGAKKKTYEKYYALSRNMTSLAREKREHPSKLEKGYLPDYQIAIIGIASGLLGIFFLSSNITGNAISNLSNTTSSWIGGVLLAVGLVVGFFWVRNKKNN